MDPSKLAAVLAFRFRAPVVMIEDLVQLEKSGQTTHASALGPGG